MPSTPIAHRVHRIQQTITRPGDTTGYTAGDVVAGNGVVAPISLRLGPEGQGILQSLVFVDSANVATKPDLELWIFDTTLVVDADNATFTPSDDELKRLLAIVPIPTASFKAGDIQANAAGNAVYAVGNLNIPLKAVPGSHEVFGVLVVRNAYAPIASEVFTLILGIEE